LLSKFNLLCRSAAVAESNAVNVTDGLDGLAASTAAVALVCTGLSLVAAGRCELAAFAICMGGAAAGFLVVNRHPASCFMGDTGSLALGGALGAVAAAAGGAATLPLLLTSGVFVAETLSVMVQVAYFKWTKKRSGTSEGVRLFRMAPLHHHLELGGWGEVKVVGVLTAAAGVCAAAGAAAAAAAAGRAAALGV
jgi:phospho-N-acetylmuramoyl-pentapeptide-transferase